MVAAETTFMLLASSATAITVPDARKAMPQESRVPCGKVRQVRRIQAGDGDSDGMLVAGTTLPCLHQPCWEAVTVLAWGLRERKARAHESSIEQLRGGLILRTTLLSLHCFCLLQLQIQSSFLPSNLFQSFLAVYGRLTLRPVPVDPAISSIPSALYNSLVCISALTQLFVCPDKAYSVGTVRLIRLSNSITFAAAALCYFSTNLSMAALPKRIIKETERLQAEP